MKTTTSLALLGALLLTAAGCPAEPDADAGGAGSDAARVDAGSPDAPPLDASALDVRAPDAARADAAGGDAVSADSAPADVEADAGAAADAVAADQTTPDATGADSGAPDSAGPDTAVLDAAAPDGTPSDAATPDSATEDATPHLDAAAPDSWALDSAAGEDALPPLPPDPATVAPALDPTVASSLHAAAGFLYSGADPIQSGVAEGAIEARRLALLRGRVLDADGAPLPRVSVAVLDHPELGQTLSRADGRYDLAVNGGGTLVVELTASGRLPAQRRATLEWGETRALPDVVLLALDAQVTTIDLTVDDRVQVARGSPVVDADGERQATLLFKPGTQAAFELADGSTHAASALDVRLTEYTVGARGPAAMPAELPATSAYTYAVELGVDQAIAAGARAVQFSQPVSFYVDNFLGFAVGLAVPTGYYDRGRAEWVAVADGRVIEVLALDAGHAALDLDGDGLADDATALAALGIDDAERASLAALYAPGQTLWRVALQHFSPWDCNFPWGPGPFDTAPGQGVPRGRLRVDHPCLRRGSVVLCQDQTLGEQLPLTGTPYRLVYRSDRVPGRRDAFQLDVRLTSATPPASLLGIELDVEVAGQGQSFHLAPAADLFQRVEWSGLSGFGQRLQGTQLARVELGYTYDAVYRQPGSGGRSFGALGAAPMTAVGRTRYTVWQRWQVPVGLFDQRALGLGGWSLDAHHVYDPLRSELHLGDGTTRRAETFYGRVVHSVAGDGSTGIYGEFPVGQPARSVEAWYPMGVLAAPDGSVYYSSEVQGAVFRVDPDGILRHVAGDYSAAELGDGGPATAALLDRPGALALGPDGSLYIGEWSGYRVRRVDPAGVITTVAGTGTRGFGGDGGPATAAMLRMVDDVAVGPDGTLYIAEGFGHRVRRVGTDGIISTFAGTGTAGNTGDGGLAALARLNFPQGVDVGPDGSVTIANEGGGSVRRVGPDGIIRLVASGMPGAYKVRLAADGGCYVVGQSPYLIYFVDSAGQRHTVAGTQAGAYLGDGLPGLQSQLAYIEALDVGPDGDLVLALFEHHRVVRLGSIPAIPVLTEQGIPSLSGRELYVFDDQGRHLRTLDTLTGQLRRRFAYDAAGRLTAIVEDVGTSTAIARDASGVATAVVAPGGQTTLLEVDASAHLVAVTHPAGERQAMSYSDDGLLRSLTEPNGNAHSFDYDAQGRLVADADADGRGLTLTRSELAAGFDVDVTTALGRSTHYRVEQLADGSLQRTTVDAAGATTVLRVGPDATEQLTAVDGRVITLRRAPDPRFGMGAPLVGSLRVARPASAPWDLSWQRQVALTDPADVLSLGALTDTLVSAGRTTTLSYDAASRRFTRSTALGPHDALELDATGRPVLLQLDPAMAPLQLTRDAAGRPAQVTWGEQQLDLARDAAGRVQSFSNALGEITAFTHDAADRVAGITSPLDAEVALGYGAGQELASVGLPLGEAHALEHDAAHALTGFAPAGLSASYQRALDLDGAHNLTTLPGGRSVAYGRDGAGRLISITTAAATVGVSYVGVGERVAAHSWTPTAGPAQTTSLAYDGDLVVATTHAGVASGEVALRHDVDGALLQRTFTSGVRVHQLDLARDTEGRVSSQGAFDYTRGGPQRAIRAIADGTATLTLDYDVLGRLTARALTVDGVAVDTLAWSYDAAGRVAERSEDAGSGAHTRTYVHDAAGRLIEVDLDAAPVELYGYDPNGNRDSRTLDGAPTEIASHDAADRLLQQGSVAYVYDDDGYLVQRGGDQFFYGARGELLRVELEGGAVIDYAYDGLGRRVGRSDASGTAQYFYANPDNAVELSYSVGVDGALTAYFYDELGLLFALERDGVRAYVAVDPVGSVTGVFDASGAVLRRLAYDAFGNAVSDSAPGFDLPLGFAGGLHDRATGLVRFGLRDYDTRAGRFAARDPAWLDGGQANLFVYVGNDPVTWRDPAGLAITAGISGYAGGGGGVSVSLSFTRIAYCGELGVGVGGGVDLSLFDTMPEDSLEFFASAEASYGPLIGADAEVSISLIDCQRHASIGGGALGLRIDTDDGFTTPLGARGLEDMFDIKARAEARMGLRGCKSFSLWP